MAASGECEERRCPHQTGLDVPGQWPHSPGEGEISVYLGRVLEILMLLTKGKTLYTCSVKHLCISFVRLF